MGEDLEFRPLLFTRALQKVDISQLQQAKPPVERRVLRHVASLTWIQPYHIVHPWCIDDCKFLPSSLALADNNLLRSFQLARARPASIRMNFFSLRNRSSNPSSILISFYDESDHDYNGRYLKDILKWSAGKLESSHDYIQMLFPLPEESGVNWNAPVIDRQVFEAFRSRPELRDNLRKAFERMLWFYGFQLSTEGPSGKVKVRSQAF